MSTSKTASPVRKLRNWPPKSVLEPGTNHVWLPKVAFDLHEVIVSFAAQFSKFANIVYPDANMFPESAQFYEMGFDPSVNVSPTEWQDLFRQFCMFAPGGYGDLPLIDGIVEQMKRIREAGIGIEIWTYVPGALSCVTDDAMPNHSGISQQQTLELIAKLGLPIDVKKDVKFVTPSEKPARMGNKHIPLLIEDNRSTAVRVADMAHAAILVPTTYNKVTCDNVLRLNSRDELADRVIEFYDALRTRGLLLEGGR